MPKLQPEQRFLDLSDYGRPLAIQIVKKLAGVLTAIDLTFAFTISGVLAVAFVLLDNPFLAAFFLLSKSVLDAADGEMARFTNKPSYVGRYLDSIADFVLNFIFVLTIGMVTSWPFWTILLAFICMELQGTLYNYYYVIVRTSTEGDKTSRIFENKAPKAFPDEEQSLVNALFFVYRFCYVFFDRAIFLLDKNAVQSKEIPAWILTLVSTCGLGFQLLVISVLLLIGKADLVIPYLIGFTLAIPILIGLRRFYSIDV